MSEETDRLLQNIWNSRNFIDAAKKNYRKLGENGVKAFFSPNLIADQIPKILEFLLDDDFKIQFLEHCVYDRKFEDGFSQQSLFLIFVNALPQIPRGYVMIDNDVEPIKSLRTKFLTFLKSTSFISPNTANESIDQHYVDEKLVVLDKLQQYDQCADIIVESEMSYEKVKDFADHCVSQPLIYTALARKIKDKTVCVNLLNEKGEYMKVTDALNFASNQIMIDEVKPFLEKVAIKRSNEIRKLKIERDLDEVIVKDKKAKLSLLESGSVEIDEQSTCGICLKRIEKSRFCICPNNMIVHRDCLLTEKNL